jgi:hypothetical protein
MIGWPRAIMIALAAPAHAQVPTKETGVKALVVRLETPDPAISGMTDFAWEHGR